MIGIMDNTEQEMCKVYDAHYNKGYQQGRADVINEILDEMTKSPFASDKATFVKKYIEEQLKEQKI